MKLWLLRHAKVALDAGLCYGASDVSASSALTLRAAQTAAALLPPGLPVWVSGLGRAQQLAQALVRLRPDLGTPTIDTRLNEINFGHWELQPWDTIPRAAFDLWLADFAQHRFGGAESTQQLMDRVAQALAELRASGLNEALWITHAGVIRAAQFVVANGRGPIRCASQWPRESPEPGGWMALEL
ncbi:MAG: phosphoglycerate kinase [Comamonadaceae bacterium]|nr:phosphoglycerate kinase [Comamonadaceae bacterium]